MPVHPNKFPELRDELAGSDWNEVQEAFQESVNQDASDAIPQAATRPEACYALLRHAYHARRLDQFLAELGNRIAALGARIQTITSNPGGCPTQASAVGMLPVIDRQSLRKSLPHLVSQFKILTIEGGQATGKSYSAHLIGLVGNGLAAADMVLVPIKKLVEKKLVKGASELEPFEFMEYVADHLGLQLRPELRSSHAQDARIVQKLVNWFEASFPQRRNDATPVWLIIDDLNFAACPPWVHELALKLAERCISAQLDDLRLVLIGLPQDRLEDAWLMSIQDVHEPLTQDDVWDYIVKAAADRHILVDPADRPEAMAEVWGNYAIPLKHEEARAVARKAAVLVRNL